MGILVSLHPVFPGPFLFSFKLRDALETVWVRGKKGPKSQVQAACSGQQSQVLVEGRLALLSSGIDASIGKVLKQRHVHVGLWEEQVLVEQKQADFCELKASLVGTASSRLAKAM